MPISEHGTKKRLLMVLLLLVERPFHYTKKALANKYNVSVDTISHDFQNMKNVGLVIKQDDQNRYGLIQSKTLKKLEQLLHFTKEDQLLLYQAIDQISPHTKSGKQLKQKLGSLYDYRKLGLTYLRKPYLSKVDSLFAAKERKKAVVLQDYRSSNSNLSNDRYVEPYHISPAEDILQAYDIQKKKIRHFRISRIKRVKRTHDPWLYEQKHIVMPTDPFRIVDANQVMVHLRMKISAYNALTEQFPLTKAYIEPDAEEDTYDFQCMVNHRFIGLSKFIISYHDQIIEILSPDPLKKHLNDEIKKIRF